MAADELVETVKEVLPFLDVLTPTDYKLKILEYLLGTTATKEGLALSRIMKLIDSLLDLICHDKDDNIRTECLKYLVNITSMNPDKKVVEKLLQEYFVEYLLNIGLLEDKPYTRVVFMLLTNISCNDENIEFIYKCFDNDENLQLYKYVDAFKKEETKWDHIGSFLANLSIVKDVRLVLLNEDNCLLKELYPFVSYEKSLARRIGVCRIIKNCLFETDYHEKLLLNEEDNILPYLLLPLAGPEEFTADESDELPLDLQYLPPDKEREKDKEVCKLLMESLLHLCTTKPCRVYLKKSGTYYILREFHKQVDENDDVLELPLENLIQMLIGDEPEIGDGNLKNIEIPEDIQKKFDEIDIDNNK